MEATHATHGGVVARRGAGADTLAAGVSSRDLVRRAVTFDRPPRLPYALILPVRSDFFELAALQRVLGTGRRRVHGAVYRDEWECNGRPVRTSGTRSSFIRWPS